MDETLFHAGDVSSQAESALESLRALQNMSGGGRRWPLSGFLQMVRLQALSKGSTLVRKGDRDGVTPAVLGRAGELLVALEVLARLEGRADGEVDEGIGDLLVDLAASGVRGAKAKLRRHLAGLGREDLSHLVDAAVAQGWLAILLLLSRAAQPG